MAYHTAEHLVEIEAGGDVTADFDQRAQLFLLPQEVTVERAVVQGMRRHVSEGFQEGLPVGFGPCPRQLSEGENAQNIASRQ